MHAIGLVFKMCHLVQVMDHVKEIHPEVLVGLISHPGLRIRKDVSRYYLAEHILKLQMNKLKGCGMVSIFLVIYK